MTAASVGSKRAVSWPRYWVTTMVTAVIAIGLPILLLTINWGIEVVERAKLPGD